MSEDGEPEAEPLDLPAFFTHPDVELQLFKFRTAHNRCIESHCPDEPRKPHFIVMATAIETLRELTRETYFRDNRPVECEIVRGIVVALEVMFTSLAVRYLI